MFRSALLILVLCLAAHSPKCGTTGAAPHDSGTALVIDVRDGRSLVLERAVGGATEVRLAGIEAPRLGLGRPGFSDWPLAHAAREILESLVLGRRVTLAYGPSSLDRHGRLHADVHREDGTWLQDEMLRRGWARVHTLAGDGADAAALIASEREARTAELGIWSHPFYAVRTPEQVERDIDSFQIVEGRVVSAARVRERVYLNFGKDWRSDFTVSIAARDLPEFAAAGIVPLALEGRVVRVRGWIESFNGPMINAAGPSQLEVLDATPERGSLYSPCCSNSPRTRAAWTIARKKATAAPR